MQVEQVALEKLKPFSKNPKIHQSEQIKKLVRSIDKEGRQRPEYYKAYYQKNREYLAKKFKERYLRVRSDPILLVGHRKKSTEATRRYRNRHPEKVKEMREKTYNSRKRRAMEMLGGAKCIRCGCDEIKFLEFNHKNGGGCKEIKQGKYQYMADKLLSGKRSPNGLEVLCRVCNALDFLERKNKEIAKKYKIEWK